MERRWWTFSERVGEGWQGHQGSRDASETASGVERSGSGERACARLSYERGDGINSEQNTLIEATNY